MASGDWDITGALYDACRGSGARAAAASSGAAGRPAQAAPSSVPRIRSAPRAPMLSLQHREPPGGGPSRCAYLSVSAAGRTGGGEVLSTDEVLSTEYRARDLTQYYVIDVRRRVYRSSGRWRVP